MNNSTTDRTILDDEAVEVIATRLSVSTEQWCLHRVLLTEAERDALCATVRALRAENEKLKASRRVHELDNHHNALACGYCVGPIKDEIKSLQSQLEQVTKERDDLLQRLSGEQVLDMLTERTLTTEAQKALEQLK